MNFDIVDKHEQKFQYSCIPMAIELVLKLIGKVPCDYCDLQNEVGNRSDLGFVNYNGRVIEGVRFVSEFQYERGASFPICRLFQRIDEILDNGQYVIVSLQSVGGWHMYVVYSKYGDDYLAVSKDFKKTYHSKKTLYCNCIKKMVCDMGGTDILTYKNVCA